MPHQNSVLHAVVNHLPWSIFDQLVEQHGADARVRRLRPRDHLVALLHGQLGGARSIREITGALQSHSARLHHVGARPVARSTLADASASRPHTLFAGLLAAMVRQGGRDARRSVGEAAHLIDSTTVSLSGLSSAWAEAVKAPPATAGGKLPEGRFSHNTCGAKLHLVLDPDADRPVYADITPCRVDDITAVQDMPVTPGVTYVSDLGYYDFAWWAELPKGSGGAAAGTATEGKLDAPCVGPPPAAQAEPSPTPPDAASSHG